MPIPAAPLDEDDDDSAIDEETAEFRLGNALIYCRTDNFGKLLAEFQS
jgi:hypothetical protein